MPDPLDALRLPPQASQPRRSFARELLDRIATEAVRDPTVGVSAAPGGSAPLVAADDALDVAFEHLAGAAPEFDPFKLGGCISNHAPMTAEALCVLGRDDVIVQWVDRYGKYLDPTPPGVAVIGHDEWRDALGDYGRVADWIALFAGELDGQD